PDPENVAHYVSESHMRGLAVTIRPLMDQERIIDTCWRGSIEPTDRDEWFASYLAFLLPYAQVAEEESAEVFVIGTEFNSLEGDKERWESLITKIKSVYKGSITYSVNWDLFQS